MNDLRYRLSFFLFPVYLLLQPHLDLIAQDPHRISPYRQRCGWRDCLTSGHVEEGPMPRANQVLPIQLAESQHAPVMAAGVHNGVDGAAHVAKDELVVPSGE